MEVRILYANETEIVDVGYLETNKFDPDTMLHLCNWIHHDPDCKPANLHSKVCSCGSGIIFVNPETEEYHLALPFDWFIGKKDDVIRYIMENPVEIGYGQYCTCFED